MLSPGLQRFVASIVALAGCIVIALGAWSVKRERALAARGVETTAAVVAVQHRPGDSETGHQNPVSLRIDGRSYEHVGVFGTSVPTDIHADRLGEAEASGRVTVRYVPDDPSVNALATEDPPGGGGWVAVLIGAVMLVGAVVRASLARRAVSPR